MFRNKTARQKNFSLVPRADIPRSKFKMRQTRKQAFNASELIPIMVEEVLPGDVWQHTEHVAARLATPLAPILDDMDIETFYFFQPNRVTWDGWEDFITGVNTAATIPTVRPKISAPGNIEISTGSVFDHMGLMPQIFTASVYFNRLPIDAYFHIWNEWYRDQNLQSEWTLPDYTTAQDSYEYIQGATAWNQMPLRINKRHDYFTSSLTWPQKGTAVTIPLGTSAPVIPDLTTPGATDVPAFKAAGVTWPGPTSSSALRTSAADNNVDWNAGIPSAAAVVQWNSSGLVADLSTATAATINALRLAFQTQKLLERDARGGSRYVEQLLAHFGARSPDYRLQRPEYLGGSRIPVTINPIAQTAAYDAPPTDAQSALGNLGAEMHANGSHRTFTYAATEHGYIIGLAVVRSTPTYQQGTRKHWLRETRLDYPWPVFGHIGEQAVLTREIYQPANNAPANATWGYQERYAEMRYTPNEITGVLRSTAPQAIDWWHLAEKFATEPALNAAFITDKTQETLERALATASSEQWSAQIIMDILHDSTVARMLPTYGDPGYIDHF